MALKASPVAQPRLLAGVQVIGSVKSGLLVVVGIVFLQEKVTLLQVGGEGHRAIFLPLDAAA